MVDRVYRSDLPRLRKILLKMRKEFVEIGAPTDWVRIRIDPLLAHLEQLNRMVRIWDSARRQQGVSMLHSDLVYFRENVIGLERVLAAERKRSGNRRPSTRHTSDHPVRRGAGKG